MTRRNLRLQESTTQIHSLDLNRNFRKSSPKLHSSLRNSVAYYSDCCGKSNILNSENISVKNDHLPMYDSRRDLGDALQQDISSWNHVIRVHVRQGDHSTAFQLFEQLLLEGVVPDKLIFVSILSACASPQASTQGKKLHACISATAFATDVVVGTALLSMYGKCGSLEDAQRMFDEMHARDIISWNVLISRCTQAGQNENALRIFYRMQQEGVLPDSVTFVCILSACVSLAALMEMHVHIMNSRLAYVVVENALITMYGKCGSVENAHKTFKEMNERDVISCNAMIAVFAQQGLEKDVLQIFRQMQQEGLTPNIGVEASKMHSQYSTMCLRKT